MRDSQLPVDEPEERRDQPEEQPQGSLRPTGPGLLTAAFLVGVVGGRLIRPLSLSLDGTAPRVGWLAVLTLWLVAAILAFVAWSTHRTYAAGRRLEPNQAVNRLVLAKACAIAGAVLAGGYLGYAISWVGDEAQLASERFNHSLIAALAGAFIVAGSLALERACRVKNPPK